jgi:salicylate hydroxylase
MTREVLVAGGGIGGLAAALAARRAGWEARVLEQAAAFSEVGAGLQLGPNATRILEEWGLLPALEAVAWRPDQVRVRDAVDGRELAKLALGDAIAARYGSPYLTVHRADLQGILLAAAEAAGARLHTGSRVRDVRNEADDVVARLADGRMLAADALVAADGVWSTVREQVVQDGPAMPTGHLAFRALAPLAELPAALRTRDVTAWLGPHMHLVAYPVRSGEALNVACFVQGSRAGEAEGWDHAAQRAELDAALGPVCGALRELVQAMPAWRLWVLHDRAPVRCAQAMACDRIALLGDAAHPMLPYLAQGAAMAIEDARELQRVFTAVADRVLDVKEALGRYALSRWQRVAQVQRRARRNGVIFHADGALRAARNVALRTAGERLLDQPWLYR